MYMHIVYIQYTLCEVLNEVPTDAGNSKGLLPLYRHINHLCPHLHKCGKVTRLEILKVYFLNLSDWFNSTLL